MFGFFRASDGYSASRGRDPRDDFWFTNTNTGSFGVSVTKDTAIQLAVYYACVRVLAETIAQLPLGVFSRDPNGDKRLQDRHPLYDLLQFQTNDEQTAVEFREQMAAFALMRGTAVAEIVPGRRGAVDQLIPLHPDHLRCVKVQDTTGRARYQFSHREPGAPERRLLRDDLFIVRSMMIDADCPLLGIDPLMAQSRPIGAALAAQDYAGRFFENDARPAGVIEHPAFFKSDEDRNVFKRAWRAAFGQRGRRHGVAVLEHGLKYHAISVTPEQAQFLETRKYSDVDICRIFRVPPHKVGILDRATFSNIEHQALEFVIDTLMPWLIRWEQAIRRDLITSPQFFAEHNVEGLLRGDIKTRFAAYAQARQWGWLSVNEIRRKENLSTIGAAGDVYLEPQNMAPVGSGGRRSTDPDERPEPEERPNGRANGAGLIYLGDNNAH